MKRRLGRLIVFAGVVGLLMVLNAGVASADHGDGNPNSPFAPAEVIAQGGTLGNCPTCGPAAATTPGSIPVGSAIGPFPPDPAATHQGAINMSGQVMGRALHSPLPAGHQFSTFCRQAIIRRKVVLIIPLHIEVRPEAAFVDVHAKFLSELFSSRQ